MGQALVQRANRALRPPGALDRLDQVAVWLAGWQRTDTPTVERPVALVAAGDHAVVRRGVSAWPGDATRAIVDAARAGVATSTVIAQAVGAVLRLVDAGVGQPSGDITVEPALSEERFVELFGDGRDQVAGLETDLLVLGDVGVGSTAAAAAVAASLFGPPIDDWVSAGTVEDEEGRRRKIEAVEAAVDRIGRVTPLEALRQVGGSEMAVLAGACLEARLRSIPVLLDGMVVAAAVAPLAVAVPGALDHCLAAHVCEPAHRRLLGRLDKRPLLDLGLRWGEGSGALAAVPLVRLAAQAVVDVATVDEWGLELP